MAYEPIYNRINWRDKRTPSINAENLNKMDSAIKTLDNRVVTLSEMVSTPVNNLLATVPGKPLDAVQGKALNDKIKPIIFATEEPTEVPENTIVMVYEE